MSSPLTRAFYVRMANDAVLAGLVPPDANGRPNISTTEDVSARKPPYIVTAGEVAGRVQAYKGETIEFIQKDIRMYGLTKTDTDLIDDIALRIKALFTFDPSTTTETQFFPNVPEIRLISCIASRPHIAPTDATTVGRVVTVNIQAQFRN